MRSVDDASRALPQWAISSNEKGDQARKRIIPQMPAGAPVDLPGHVTSGIIGKPQFFIIN